MMGRINKIKPGKRNGASPGGSSLKANLSRILREQKKRKAEAELVKETASRRIECQGNICGMTKNKHRTKEEKEAIVAESRKGGARVGAVARKYGIPPSELSRWRKQLPANSSGKASQPHKRSGPRANAIVVRAGGARMRIDRDDAAIMAVVRAMVGSAIK